MPQVFVRGVNTPSLPHPRGVIPRVSAPTEPSTLGSRNGPIHLLSKVHRCVSRKPGGADVRSRHLRLLCVFLPGHG